MKVIIGMRRKKLNIRLFRTKTCFRCNKTGHIAAPCRSKLVNKVNQSSSDRPPVKCFRCLELRHITKDCKNDFERKSVREDQQFA